MCGNYSKYTNFNVHCNTVAYLISNYSVAHIFLDDILLLFSLRLNALFSVFSDISTCNMTEIECKGLQQEGMTLVDLLKYKILPTLSFKLWTTALDNLIGGNVDTHAA